MEVIAGKYRMMNERHHARLEEKMKQTILDTLALVGLILAIGLLFWWANWDEPINYRIERTKPEAKFVKV